MRAPVRHAKRITKECHIKPLSSQSVTTRASLAVGAVAFGVAVVLDQISKWIVLETIGPNGSRDIVTVIPSVLQFKFVRNTGSAFGMFQGNSDILKVLAILAVLGLFGYYVRSARHDWVVSLALGLQVGGALGNIIDRFRHGYVVDFIDFPRFPTFNIADSAITVGVALLMYAVLFRDPQLRESAERSSVRDTRQPAGDDV